ncbi:hypothetical protein C8R46DRAFT_1230954 [Mycena filopes]|nr:hypothetical protein C8R46DRAFT_1230954 [Mycena filopes]
MSPGIGVYVLENAQLTQIKAVYNIFDELSLTEPRNEVPGSLSDPFYPSCILLPPRSQIAPNKQQLKSIAAALCTRSGAGMRAVGAALKGRWDTMSSCSLGTRVEDSRDATYVRYEMLVDKNARFPRRDPEFELNTFYGQLTHIYRVHFPAACPALSINIPTTFIFAAIRACVLKPDDPDLRGLDVHYIERQGALDVIDITSVQALVGRVQDTGGNWAVIDRSGALARADWKRDGDEIES